MSFCFRYLLALLSCEQALRLAMGMALDAGKLATWQSARILHVEHDPLGREIDPRLVR